MDEEIRKTPLTHAERQQRYRDKQKLMKLKKSFVRPAGAKRPSRRVPTEMLENLDRPLTSAERRRRCRARKKLLLQNNPTLAATLAAKHLQWPRSGQINLQRIKPFITHDETPESSFVMVKEEPREVLNFIQEYSSSYCRCCFKLMSPEESQIQSNEDSIKIFEEIIQFPLEPSHLAQNFCGTCSADLNYFNDFKKLAVLRQQKFMEISQSSGDLNELHQMKLTNDPLDAVKIEDEKDSASVIKVEFIEEPPASVERPAPKKRGPKPSLILCPKCPVRPYNLKKHLLRCHTLRCNACKFETIEDSEMDAHIEKKHLPKDVPELCPICGKSVKRRMEQHIEAVHKKVRNYFCDLCGFSAYERNYLLNHMRGNHLDRTFKCDKCDFMAISNWRLTLHERNKHIPKEVLGHNCPECNKFFKSRPYLQKHIQRKHEQIRNVECSICHRKFFEKAELTRHCENVHSEKKYVCEVCGNIYSSPIMLKKHKLLHMEPENQLACEYCDKRFPLKARLITHIQRLHMQVRNFLCKVCDKSFYRIEELRSHNLKHQGITFNCYVPGCTSAVTRKSVLVYHFKHNHNLAPEVMEEYMKRLNEFCKEIKISR